MFFRLLLMLHRWVGVALCTLFLLWFPSGIGMMYWGMPAITVRDRLERWPTLDPSKIVVSPIEAAKIAGVDPPIDQVRLNSYDGRPAYRIGAGGDVHIVYADTGEEQGTASRELRDRAAAAWTGQSAQTARVDSVTELDQWIVGNQLRNLRPLWKYSWTSGDQVYIGDSGEVLLHTTTKSRLAAYVSAVPHWLYLTPLRARQPFWIRFTTYAAMVGTAGAIVGVVIGVWLYSPRKRYRFAGAPSRIPYRGQKRWHVIFGLIFGLATVTWTFSGSLAFLPFPAPRPVPQVRQIQPQAGLGRGVIGRRGGDRGLAAMLRGRASLGDFADTHPRAILGRLEGLDVKELSLTSFDGQALYSASLHDGTAKLIALDGRVIDEFDRDAITDIVKTSAAQPELVETKIVEQYDYYYLDRRRQRPLPVILAEMHDADSSRYYIDPKTATVVGTYSERNWARRFFYNGLHSLSFPWLYNHRPLWDVVVIAFMTGGTALCVTSLLLAWRVLGRKLRRVAAAAPRRARDATTLAARA
jgi:hypothetical protein